MTKEKQPDKLLGETVPEQLPPLRTDVPTPARTVRGLLALPGMVLLWIMPKRVGPSLTGSGWRAAIAAHLAAVAFGTGMIAWAEWLPGQAAVASLLHPDEGQSGLVSASEWLRAPLAAWALICKEHCAAPGGALSFVLGVIAFEVALFLVAVSLMPFAAAGEKVGPLFGRCIRLTWWSTTTLLLLGLGWLLEGEFRKLIGLPAEPGWLPVDYALLAAFATWWLFVLLRSANRYAGPPEGPAWQPRTPVCHGCGYNIACLSHSTNCPECGGPVEESLPQNLDSPSYATAEGIIARSKTFWATVSRAFSGKAFFGRISVWRGHAQARRFVYRVVLFNAIIVAVFAAYVWPWESPLHARLADAGLHRAYSGIIAFSILLMGQVLVLGLLTSALGLFCSKRFQPIVTACFYASAASIPVPVLGIAWIFSAAIYFTLRGFPGSEVALGYLAGTAVAILPFVAFYPVIRGFVRAWRCARRANA
jgi:hypothetical protein